MEKYFVIGFSIDNVSRDAISRVSVGSRLWKYVSRLVISRIGTRLTTYWVSGGGDMWSEVVIGLVTGDVTVKVVRT